MSFYSSLTLLPVLFLAALLDVRSGTIPNELVILGAALAHLTHLLEGRACLPSALAVALILLLLLLRHFHLIGGADIKLFLLILFLLPESGALFLIFLSFLMNAVFGLALLFLNRTHRIPMAPGIFAAATAFHLFGGLL